MRRLPQPCHVVVYVPLNPCTLERKKQGSGIVISGASTGIGYHAAVSLADDFTVYAGVRKEADAERLKGLGNPNLVPVILDVAKQESVDASFETITADAAQRGIAVTGIVNNAGIFKAR